MRPCVKESPNDDLQEMHQDRPSRDANQHPCGRPEALYNGRRSPLHPVNGRGQAHSVDRHAERHQTPGNKKFREHAQIKTSREARIYRDWYHVVLLNLDSAALGQYARWDCL